MKSFALAALAGSASAAELILEDFTNPAHTWRQQNDPVMGGQSTGTFTIVDDRGVFDGEVVDVPSLAAPGFIKVGTTDRDIGFPDISGCTGLGMKVRETDAYDGYRISVGTDRPPPGTGGGFFTSGYKAPFFVADSATFNLPFTEFSTAWNDATGDIETTCAEDERVCLTKATLEDITKIEVWGEGKRGVVHLEIEQIFATGCGNATAVTKPAVAATKMLRDKAALRTKPVLGEDLCAGDVQANLRYNMSVVGLTAIYDLPYQVADGATLADAICCDSAFEPYAEPQFTFQRNDVNLFAEMESSDEFKQFGYVTFYDSVCGEPLYRAPVGRSMEDFMEDTVEHYWPSFREAEIIEGATYVREGTDYVFSKCGTHLGSDLPEDSPWGRRRHCIDTVCVAGNGPVMLAMKK